VVNSNFYSHVSGSNGAVFYLEMINIINLNSSNFIDNIAFGSGGCFYLVKVGSFKTKSIFDNITMVNNTAK
jgi:hypothetical protein